MPFMRSAKAGGWKSSLPSEAVAEIESAWAPLMRVLGYELVGDSRPSDERTLFDLIDLPHLSLRD
jgi:hypothetical protein